MSVNVIGTAFMDVVVQTPVSGFEPDNVVFSKYARITAGGNGCNLAINLAKNDVDTTFYGMIGKDYAGNVILGDFKKHHVKYEKVFNGETGISLVMVDKNGERSVASFQGMNNTVESKLINSIDLDKDTAICGLGLLPNIENNIDVFIRKIHVTNHILYAGTTGDTSVLYQSIKNGIYNNLDFLFMNNLEAKRLCRRSNIVNCGKFLTNECSIRNVVITEGENGATLITKDKVCHVDGIKVKSIDSTGAGDAFMAQFIKKYSENKNKFDALKSANIAGSRNVQFFGAVK